jgi:collagen type I/II/III/V/XI/XXIV/XXVII alpha
MSCRTRRYPALAMESVCRPGFTSERVSGVVPTTAPSSSTSAPGGDVEIRSEAAAGRGEAVGTGAAGVGTAAGRALGVDETARGDVAVLPGLSGARSTNPAARPKTTAATRTLIAMTRPQGWRGRGGCVRLAPGRAGLARGGAGAARSTGAAGSIGVTGSTGGGGFIETADSAGAAGLAVPGGSAAGRAGALAGITGSGVAGAGGFGRRGGGTGSASRRSPPQCSQNHAPALVDRLPQCGQTGPCSNP